MGITCSSITDIIACRLGHKNPIQRSLKRIGEIERKLFPTLFTTGSVFIKPTCTEALTSTELTAN